MLTHSNGGFRFQRAKERKHYTDMDIDEDDIDGKRNYNIEEKLLRNNFTGNFVQEMKGHGEIEEMDGSSRTSVDGASRTSVYRISLTRSKGIKGWKGSCLL